MKPQLKCMVLATFLVCRFTWAIEDSDLPQVSEDLRIVDVAPIYAVQARTIVARGADETIIELNLESPCDSIQQKVLTGISKLKDFKGQLTAANLQGDGVNRILRGCKLLIQSSITGPMNAICDAINGLETVSTQQQPNGRFILPAILWATRVVARPLIAAASAYLGYQLGEAELVKKINAVSDITNENFGTLAKATEDATVLMHAVEAQLNVTIENVFHLSNVQYMLSQTKRTIIEERRLPRDFLEFYHVQDEARQVRHQQLVSCTPTIQVQSTGRDSDSAKPAQTSWRIVYRTPAPSPHQMFRSGNIEIANHQCILEFAGPQHLVYDPVRNESCFVNLDQTQAAQPVVLLPDCIEREYGYIDLTRKNCQRKADEESLDKVILLKEASVIYCRKRIWIDGKVYKCPKRPFKIVSYNLPSPTSDQPQGRVVQFRNSKGKTNSKFQTIDYRAAKVEFNIDSALPGLIAGPSFANISLHKVPHVNGTSIWTKIKDAVPDAVHGIVGAVTGFSILKLLFNFKAFRLLAYALPLIGGWLVWQKARRQRSEPAPANQVPSAPSKINSSDRIIRLS